jgi:Uma2 family endonuclease
MTTMAASTVYTPEEMLDIEDQGLFELVDGKLVEKAMSSLGGKCALRVGQHLQNFLDSHQCGDAMSEVSLQCFPHDPGLVRRPDISFFTAARANSVPDGGHVTIAPDIAIEVISPGNRINEFEEKLADYRSAGIKLVWEVNPTFCYVRIHRPDRTTQLLEAKDTLTGESILPGFSVKVAELMPPNNKKAG